ncbi:MULTISPECIES: VOC family protein [Rhizobium/Agrobacterium group]|jgi:lactoylglutathione lyase|uniref:VOC family protein n=2 Tax=Neorhizobium TaxID=1525371 RepID=A0ABV0M3Z3_9HYPH|nr:MULTISPECIES: VOC family protein [Rhizobium/Agrobacterium group]MCC2613502.1 VOC family protein [Neorhizobium petrolearium]WGI71825.1 VOC family protein [Neorhizobium petrolearium]
MKQTFEENMPASTTTPQIQGIYETHLTVASLKTSIPFYRDVLGLELAAEFIERRIAFFWVDGKKNGMLGLWETGTGPLRMRLHLAFRLARDEMMQAPSLLQAKGIEVHGFHGEPITEPIVIGWMPALSLYFHDPDGHSIEFISVLNDEPDADFGMRPYAEWTARR